jgi:hypothetical protein
MPLMQTSWLNYPATLDYAPLARCKMSRFWPESIARALQCSLPIFYCTTYYTNSPKPARIYPIYGQQISSIYSLSVGIYVLSEQSTSETPRTGTVSESQSRPGFRRFDVRRHANLSPSFCIGCTRCLGLASVFDGVTAQQEMCGQSPPPPPSRCGGFNRPALGVSAADV